MLHITLRVILKLKINYPLTLNKYVAVIDNHFLKQFSFFLHKLYFKHVVHTAVIFKP